MENVLEIVSIKQVVKKRKAAHLLKGITSPSDAAEIARKEIGNEDREVFLILALNTKNEVNAIHRCHVGSINASIVHPREVYKACILNNASSIVLAHNHPSYNCEPSKEDKDVTKRIVEAGKILGIEVLDHIIVGGDNYISFREKGLL